MIRHAAFTACFALAFVVVRNYVDHDWCATVLQLILGYALASTVYAFVTSYLPLFLLPDLKNKAIIVTGCDSGFGNQLAQRLDSLGVTVYAGCLFADGPLAMELKQKTSERLHIVQLDVTKQNEVDEAVKYVKETLKDKMLWSVINNAGFVIWGELEWFTIDDVNKMIDVNLYGQMRMTKSFLPLLRESKGRVVNVNSLAGRVSAPTIGAYCCSKHASVAFTDALRREMKKMSISVHSVEPAAYQTPFMNGIHNIKMWNDAPTDIKEAYGLDYCKDMHGRIQRVRDIFTRPASHIYLVVDCMVDAALGTHPKVRYIPGIIEKGATCLADILPYLIMDFILECAAQTTSLARLFHVTK